jgi:YnbE-like lipoprotein
MDEGHTGMGYGRHRPVRLLLAALGMAGAMTTGGCITVKAPDKPIVIELNINIKQEVVYRLAGDASQTIENNKEVF